MIPNYIPKWVEEVARGVGVAVLTYLVTSIASSGIPTTQEALIALATGALPIIWAAVRTALNYTPVTPPLPPPDA